MPKIQFFPVIFLNLFLNGIYLPVMPNIGVSPEVGKKQKREERLNDGNNNGQLRIANTTSGGARKAAWTNASVKGLVFIGRRLHNKN